MHQCNNNLCMAIFPSFCISFAQALLNLGTRDPSLRLAAYNLLCAVTKSFNLKIEERLLEGSGVYEFIAGSIYPVALRRCFSFLPSHASTRFALFPGLCIPANNTMFIVGLSEKLAAREPQLTLEVGRFEQVVCLRVSLFER